MKNIFILTLIAAAAYVAASAYQATQNTRTALHHAKSFQELSLTCAMEPQLNGCNDPSLATAAGPQQGEK